jgi:thiamine-monophosphate kinase
MDERAALALIADRLTGVSDDCAIVDDTVLTTDMLHERTDFPEGVTRYTAGWRAVAASLSDVAAMGAEAVAAVAVYGAPSFDETELSAFLDGALDVCTSVDAVYVGGDLDGHEEFTVASTALGRTDEPVRRSGARAGDAVCVTGTLGCTATALRLFERDDLDRANELFRFPPRVAAGRALAPHATAMMDSSDGLARSAHQLADASGCSLALDEPLPIDESIREVADDEAEAHELGVFVGEDFELVCTLPESALRAARQAVPTTLSRIGTVTGADPTGTAVTLDGDPLPDRGYTH